VPDRETLPSDRKPVPVNVMLTPEDPRYVVEGETEEIVGFG